MEFDRDDARAGGDEWRRERAFSSTYVDNQVATIYLCDLNEAIRPLTIELVPSPARLCAGHGGAPSRRTDSCRQRSHP